MSPRIAPLQTADRQLLRFNQEARFEAQRLAELVARRSRVGTFDELPADSDGEAGDVFHVLGMNEWKHDGTVWRPIHESIMCRRPPLVAQWTQFGSTTDFSDKYGTIRMSGPAGGGTATRRGGTVKLTVNTTTGCIDAGFHTDLNDDTGAGRDYGFGVVAYDHVTGETVGAEYIVTLNTTPAYAILRLGYGATLSAATWSGGTVTRSVDTQARFLRIRFDGAGYIHGDVSRDRVNWYEFSDILRTTTFPTAAGNVPTRVGMYHVNGGLRNPVVDLFHFEQSEHKDVVS